MAIGSKIELGRVMFLSFSFSFVALWIIVATGKLINVQYWCWEGEYKLILMLFGEVELFIGQ